MLANMDFKCNFCSFLSDQINDMFSHLRKDHRIVENSERIKCFINYQKQNCCQKSYLTFSGLRTHIKSCLEANREQIQVVRINLENYILFPIFE